MKIKIPDYIEKILAALSGGGYQAYIVGGAVRDILLGAEPKDYDIATDARPEEVASLADRQGWPVVEKLGQNFGVVVVVADGQGVEVATFRREIYGTDAHRPHEVEFAVDLREDLSRRDFTVNAMALTSDGVLTDLFDGQVDLTNKILRTVGLASNRFSEDALRMFRACRFCAQLGFRADDAILPAIRAALPCVRGLSRERVRKELELLLLSLHVAAGLRLLVDSGLAGERFQVREAGRALQAPILPELAALSGVLQNERFHQYDVWEHTVNAVAVSKAELIVRWAVLLHDVAKGTPGVRAVDEDGVPSDHGHDIAGGLLAQEILQRFGYPPAFVGRVAWLVAQHMNFGFHQNSSEKGLRHWLRKLARSGEFRTNRQLVEALWQLKEVCLADLNATTAQERQLEYSRYYAERLIKAAEDMPVHTSDLAVGGDEIGVILLDKKSVGEFLKLALVRVQDGNLKNEGEVLREAARSWLKRASEEKRNI